MSALTETEINIRKQTLDAELAQHKSALNELEQKKTNLTAQVYAVSGAIQQCDLFLQQLNDEGKTILIVTHEEDISLMCKRIVRLKDGVIMEDKKIKQNRLV